jgi:hypothetical protein
MAKRRGKRSSNKRQAPPASTAELERLLNELERSMLAGQPPTPAELERLLRNPDRLATLLAERLLTGRAAVPMMALDLLNMFGGDRAGELLDRVASSPEVADDVRFGAQRRLGWPEASDDLDVEADEEEGEDEVSARLAFLDSLRDADGTLVGAVGVADGTIPPDAEILTEVLSYLEVLPDERCQALVRRLAEQATLAATLQMQALLHFDDESTARQALQALVERRAHGAVGALQRLARTTSNERLRQEATEAAQRLALRPVDATIPLPPIDQVWLSLVDGQGGQALLLSRTLDSGINLIVNLYFDEVWGIKTVSGISPAPEGLLEEMVEESEEEGVSLIEVDLPIARGALAIAFDYNVARGLSVPPAFELWEPLLHDTLPPASDEPIERPELDDTAYQDRDDLLADADELLDDEFFDSWGLDDARTLEALSEVAPPSGEDWEPKTYLALTEKILDPEAREQLRLRLRRQAWMLERTDDDRARDQALACAALLASATTSALAENSFIRGLLERSVADLLLPSDPDLDGDEDLASPL